MATSKNVAVIKLWLLFVIFSVVATAAASQPGVGALGGSQRPSIAAVVVLFGLSLLSVFPLRRARRVDIAVLSAGEVVWFFGVLAASSWIATALLVIAFLAIVLSGIRLGLYLVGTESNELIGQVYGKAVRSQA